MAAPNPLHLEFTTDSDWAQWTFNLPLQITRNDDGTADVLNYMHRRESVAHNEDGDGVPAADLPRLCNNAAKVLRNLALLMEAFGRGEIDCVRSPTQTVESAIEDAKSAAG